MKEISLSEFKVGFYNIADLVVSLDKDYKVILKPKSEISNFIASKSLEEQLTVVEELIEIYQLGVISESFLKNKGADYWPKISFEDYCKNLLRRIENKLKNDQFIEDNRLIGKIKDNLNGINSKSSKINHLLDKKRLIEGDYPKESKEILENDPVYIFLKKELKYWKEYIEVPINSKKEQLPQLPTNLTNIQRETLFDLLVKHLFIPATTNKEGFVWAFGGLNEKYNSFSIEWLKDKNLAVYLIDQLCYDKRRTLQSNYLSIGSKIFGIKSMAQIRNGYKNNDNGFPYNSKQIDTILEEVKGTN